ncbi:hypothetical protein TNCV_1086371 [Trichonephila clavipes]|nr:hypothetical protein TNCV_1086371 [Trichonephila clavipes]
MVPTREVFRTRKRYDFSISCTGLRRLLFTSIQLDIVMFTIHQNAVSRVSFTTVDELHGTRRSTELMEWFYSTNGPAAFRR